MKKTLLVSLLAFSALLANPLVLENGMIKAHTEVFGDSHIEPSTKAITSHLTIGEDIGSMGGSIDVSVNRLKSDNTRRDEHMDEALDVARYPLAHYTFRKVTPSGIDGILEFHGVKHPLHIDARITDNGKTVTIHGKSHISLADYKVKPIKLLLLTVRDRIDLLIDVTLKKK